MNIYRIEHAETQEGPYNYNETEDDYYCVVKCWLREVWGPGHRSLSSLLPYACDGLMPAHCGAPSMAALHWWFPNNREAYECMEREGFIIRIFPWKNSAVVMADPDSHQVIFFREQLAHIEEKSIMSLLTLKEDV